MPSPLRLIPDLRRRVWGGGRLPARFAGVVRCEDGGEPIGEAWLAGPDAIVDDGSATGVPLATLVERDGAALVGVAAFARYGGVPLLLKLLDAAAPLSLQVHPDDAYARARGGGFGKAEAWWVLDAAPGARVSRGFRRAISRDELAVAVRAGRLAALMHDFVVAPGDVVINPPGTVHALGGGLVVYEVQQPSDVTYRLDDHGRVGPDGRPRTLHLDDGVAVADCSAASPAAPPPRDLAPGRRLLALTAEFVLEEIDPSVAGGVAWGVGVGSCEFLTHVGSPEAVATLTTRAGDTTLRGGETLLLPAALGAVRLSGAGLVARAYLPD
jgi:mannose-6-phosphate isomerase